ncbi:MAG: L-aspartate oxidase, partial [Planctomycetes bacterium]|nr:L-aspartate oxidase [Planctomycetota bacterium]
HVEDTLYAGGGLCEEEPVRILVEEGPEVIGSIKEYVQFDRNEKGDYALGQEGAHSMRRILHADGDATGRELEKGLLKKAYKRANTTFLQHHRLVDLLMNEGQCVGGIIRNRKKDKMLQVHAGAVVLATGGYSHIYQETTNPTTSTGDGIYLALKAGACFRDPEFVQFHPTALFLAGAPRFLISEAVRGEGAILKSAEGVEFMKSHHDMGELAPRDVVSRGIIKEMIKTGQSCVFLDMSHLDPKAVHNRFPNIAQFCEGYGLDIARQWIPVRPAAHYCMGGIKTDLWGETGVENLYACGEVASTGVHGANRLASNSLLEALVYGRRVANALSAKSFAPRAKQEWLAMKPKKTKMPVDLDDVIRTLKALLWKGMGVYRNGEGLEKTESRIRKLIETYGPYAEYGGPWKDFISLSHVSLMACLGAKMREESRGAHQREDFPTQTSGAEGVHTELTLKDLNLS